LIWIFSFADSREFRINSTLDFLGFLHDLLSFGRIYTYMIASRDMTNYSLELIKINFNNYINRFKISHFSFCRKTNQIVAV